MIADGAVIVRGTLADKAARLVDAADPIELLGPRPRFVGRGGEKLDAALEHFSIDVSAKEALDVGASTGGFTDCLLQRGAASVVALDVGHGQLDSRLRADPRVRCIERTNVRFAYAAALGGPFAVVVVDVSFISLATVAPTVAGILAAEGADIVALVKPQFEAPRVDVARGRGVIRDPEIWRGALVRASSALATQAATMMGVMVSPLRGAEGNVEFLVHARAHAGSAPPRTVEAAIAGAVTAAGNEV